MNGRTVPASSGWYSITIVYPEEQAVVDEIHKAFDEWTLKLAMEGPAESLRVMPSFSVIDETEESAALLKLEWSEYPAASAWEAAKDVVEETLRVVAPQLVEDFVTMRITVEASRILGMDVEIPGG